MISDLCHQLARALRSTPCRCSRDYGMKVVHECSRCSALSAYDLAVARKKIIQSPRYHQNCSTCVCVEQETAV